MAGHKKKKVGGLRKYEVTLSIVVDGDPDDLLVSEWLEDMLENVVGEPICASTATLCAFGVGEIREMPADANGGP